MDQYILSGAYPKWQIHTVELSLQNDEFKGTLRMQIGGNCLGGVILKMAIDSLVDGDYEPKDDESRRHCLTDEDGLLIALRLFDKHGEDLIIDEMDTFADNIVGVRIVDVVPEK